MNLIRGLVGIPKLDTKKDSIVVIEPEKLEVYLVSKMYSPKRKDELSLSKGEMVNVIEERDGRCLVETISKMRKQERGWVPQFCLQKQVKSNGNASGEIFCLVLI